MLESHLTNNLTLLSKHIDSEQERGFFLNPKGQDHYRLLAEISMTYFNEAIIDLGTYKGLSALALSINPTNKVITYDINHSKVIEGIRLRKNIEFKTMDYNEDIKFIAKHKVIFLDIDPHDGIQETKFYELISKTDFKGLLICDDIHLNNGMKTFWESVDIKKKDMTSEGHYSGTGFIYFN